MYWDLVDFTLEGGYALTVRFADGLVGKVRFHPSHMTGIFEPLRDASFFSKAYIDDGVLTWPGEIDLAPDAMHRAIKEHGEWVLT